MFISMEVPMKKLLFFLLVIINSFIFPQVIRVPADFPNIQSAIDSSKTGDTVLIADGIYYENLSIVDKSITLASFFLIDSDTSHISQTVIDGSQPTNTDHASVISISNCYDTTSIFGLTITGGYGSKVPDGGRVGGGIMSESSNLIISNNHIIDNVISSTTVPDSYPGATGGGLAISPMGVENTFVHIRDNLISNNIIESDYTAGAGIALIVFTNVIELNYIIEDNTIRNNINRNHSEWKSMGGGITIAVYIPTKGIQIIKNNLICKNQVKCYNVTNGHSFGGGIYLILKEVISTGLEDSTSSPIIYNNIFEGNYSDYYGGAASVWRTYWPFNSERAYPLQSEGKHSPKPSFINNTFVNNISEKDGAAIFIMNVKPLIMNNILWDSYPDTAEYGELFLGDEEYWKYWVEGNNYGGAHLAYNDIRGGWNGEGEENLLLDPYFADSLFNLSDSSFCVGNGIASIEMNGTTYNCPSEDFFGNPRPNLVDSYIDIGAIESSYLKNEIPVGIINNELELQAKFYLTQNYPNPFNPSTTIKYSIPSEDKSQKAKLKSGKENGFIPSAVPTGRQVQDVRLVIYDILGRKVAVLVNEKQKPGNYEVEWNASNNPSGVYFYKLTTSSFSQTKKMILLR